MAIVCLGFTGPRAGWAEPAHVEPVDVAPADAAPADAAPADVEPVHVEPVHVERIDDPYAPHVTSGTTARLGTAVGFLSSATGEVVAIGGTLAVGQRFDRLTIESELDYLALQAKDGTALRIGDAERLGVMARFDVLRLGSTLVGGNSLASLYVEGGALVAWNHWYRPGPHEPMRTVPEDTQRVEGQVGFGVMIDHRLARPIEFLRRVGWFLGWRLALAPHQAEVSSVCRGAVCRTATAMPEEDARLTDHSMLFQTSLVLIW
jgi:hypothetical protein